MAKLVDSKETIAVLQKTNFQFKKQFGQNFLIDSSVLDHIISHAKIQKEDLVIEIGPGIGTLTEALCEHAGQVIAIEIDDKLIPILEENLAGKDNFHLLHQDVLKVDFTELLKKLPLSSITVMVQKEVAERMQAGPGSKDYGALSLAVQYYSKPEIVQEVPPHCFIPRPKVSSMVIHLSVYKESPVECENPEYLFKTIKASFMQRRKTLVNALSAGLSLDKEVIKSVLSALSYPENVRGETLSLDEFAEISDNLDPEWREQQKSVFCRFCE